MKRILLALMLVLVAGAALVLALRWRLTSAARPRAQDVRLHGLRAPVEVWRDSLGVPHLWAESEEDLLFAQGYVHAQDRLWQMELFRRVTEGRLAQILGERLLETDKFLRTLGMWRAAGELEASLDTEERRRLGAYARGVNAWLRDARVLPPEFRILRFRPEPWSVRHILAIEKAMAWDLASYQIGLDLARAVRRLGAERAQALVPDYPEFGPLILETPVPPEIPAIAAALLDALSMTRASNAWVVGGSRTRSGKPILANDMHLALRAPSLWYLMALHGGGYDVVGMTIPGAPFVIAGHNRAIAWGHTNAMLDDVDFFLERVDPADAGRYLTPGGSEEFRTTREVIHVKGADSAVVFPVRWTRHGPVLTPVEERAGNELIALRWAAHDHSNTWRALPALNRASSWSEFVSALRDFDDPHQNVVYADTAGHFGYYMSGRVPLRAGGRRPPLLPVPGWTGDWDWTGELPFERHPHVLDPPSGYVVTANNRQAAGPLAELITTDWEEPFRALRIRERVVNSGPLDAAGVHDMQLDVRDALAARYRVVAVAAAERADLPAAAQLLRTWDLEARPESRGAALFYAWYESLARRAARSLYGAEDGWFPREAVNRVLEERTLSWSEDGAAEFARLAARAMQDAAAIAADKTWGELHYVEAAHALGSIGTLNRLLRLNVGPLPHGGSPTTVNVATHTDSVFPLTARHGPSQRHVVDMADVNGAGGFVLTTGQSGVPTSRHYRDQFARWREGGLWQIPLDREAARARSVERVVLEPVRE